MRLPADEIARALLGLRPPVIILPHDRADVDAVAAAYGVCFFLKKRKIPSVLCIPSISSHAAKILRDFRINYATDCEVDDRDVVVVDTSSSSMLPVDVFSARKVVVIDHHGGGDLRGFVFPRRSCSEIVAEILIHFGLRDKKTYALLSAGIVSDTAGLYAADANSLRVLSTLLEYTGMDVSDVYDLLSERRSVSERIARLRALERMKIYRMGDYIVAISRVGSYEGSAAWLLVEAGADLAFVAGKGRISGRASNAFIVSTGIDLTDIFSEFASRVGGEWGGHPAAAGIRVEDEGKALETVVSIVEELLRKKGYRFVLRAY